jgi:hypothetical protein
MFKKSILAGLIAILIAGSWVGLANYQEQQKLADQARFRTYVTDIVSMAKVPISEVKKQLLINKIINISNKQITSQLGREIFVLILFIETKFNHSLKSPVGATGIAQLMPKYFSDFAKICNLSIKPEDINDLDVNLTVGACLFNDLLAKQKGNYLLAAAAYNAGNESPTVKKLKQLGSINTETANYIAKLAFLRKTVGTP